MKRLTKLMVFIALLVGIFCFCGSETIVYASSNSSATYVLNKNTKKFHYYSCSSVSDMSEKNKVFSDESPEEIMAKGYSPCQKCHPENGASSTTAVKKSNNTRSSVSSDCSYVLNKNTKKFHDPSCPSVSDIKPKNRIDTDLSRDEIVSQGYQPCKKCKP